jgi:hypothetical protein
MPEVRGPLVTALECPLLIVSAVRAVSQSKPLMLLTPALSAGIPKAVCPLCAVSDRFGHIGRKCPERTF